MTMEELVAKLNEASEAYYNGREIMSNKEFDDLMDQLKSMEAAEGRTLYDSPTVKVGFAPVDSLPKFTHTYPALSLDKTKNMDEFINKFRKGIEDSREPNDRIVLMWKEDGSTVQAYYKDGRLQHLVTRGNGEVGSDITHNATVIAGIPLRIFFKGDLVVRGEALISYDDFNVINEKLPDDEKFKNPRNLAAASIQMLDPNEVAKRHVIVKAFNLVHISSDNSADAGLIQKQNTFSGRLGILYALGFYVVENYVTAVDGLNNAMKGMYELIKDYIYPVDGLVAAMDNYTYTRDLTGTEHHPHIMSGYAFKWEDIGVETVLREIEWSPSRTGLLNPVAIFDPVEIDGTTVQRASLHNLSIMRKMRIHVGNRLSVYKSNMVVPYVDLNLDYNDETDYDDDFVKSLIGCCPTCGTPAKVHVSPDGIETIYCPNEECPEKMIGKLVHFCERDCMDIQGMSEETITKLVDAGFIKEYKDFFELDKKPGIAFLPGFGKTSWNKLCDAAEKAQETTFVKFITALSIPNIGKGQAKALYKYLSENYDDLCNVAGYDSTDYSPVELLSYLADISFDFTKIDGFGSVLANGLTQWLIHHFRIDYFSENGTSPEVRAFYKLTFTDRKPSTADSIDSAIAGKSFCITGKLIHHANRQALVDVIEANGGRWVDSVSNKTDYLINNDVTSTSGKNKKAHDLNIPIISEEDFLKLL